MVWGLQYSRTSHDPTAALSPCHNPVLLRVRSTQSPVWTTLLAKSATISMRRCVPVCREPPGLQCWRWPTEAWFWFSCTGLLYHHDGYLQRAPQSA